MDVDGRRRRRKRSVQRRDAAEARRLRSYVYMRCSSSRN